MSEEEDRSIEKDFDLLAEIYSEYEEYQKIKMELEPLLTQVVNVMSAEHPRKQQLKIDYKAWKENINKANQISGLLSPIRKNRIESDELNLDSVLSMFSYLGFVESVGVNIINFLILLLIAKGEFFHIERIEMPSIIHAKSLNDIEDPRVTLGLKLAFLQRNGLRNSVKLIDRKLRNRIAHLDFDVDKWEDFSRNVNEKTKIFWDMLSYILVIIARSDLEKILV